MIDIPRDTPIVILTGAGISAESGIQTFRASDGLWCDHRIEDVATPEAFMRNPSLVHEFYNMRRAQLLSPDIRPNAAHKALAELERDWPGGATVITQNIDDLHERAGSRKLIHMHGELLQMFCVSCGKKDQIRAQLHETDSCRFCMAKATLRPDIVWFGEIPYDMDRIYDLITDCGLFLSIGTSGNVYPAAGFVSAARAAGAHTIEINLEKTMIGRNFHDHIHGPAGETVPALVRALLSQKS
jgi:NAD-dependent deacetylase